MMPWRSVSPTVSVKKRVKRAKPRLNGRNRRDSLWVGLSSSAHRAGVSVSATIPEITTATATVTANCW